MRRLLFILMGVLLLGWATCHMLGVRIGPPLGDVAAPAGPPKSASIATPAGTAVATSPRSGSASTDPWRRTAAGWQRADRWPIRPRPTDNPPHPLLLLGMLMIALGATGLLLGDDRPRQSGA